MTCCLPVAATRSPANAFTSTAPQRPIAIIARRPRTRVARCHSIIPQMQELLLAEASASGAEVWRGASVRAAQYRTSPGGRHRRRRRVETCGREADRRRRRPRVAACDHARLRAQQGSDRAFRRRFISPRKSAFTDFNVPLIAAGGERRCRTPSDSMQQSTSSRRNKVAEVDRRADPHCLCAAARALAARGAAQLPGRRQGSRRRGAVRMQDRKNAAAPRTVRRSWRRRRYEPADAFLPRERPARTKPSPTALAP